MKKFLLLYIAVLLATVGMTQQLSTLTYSSDPGTENIPTVGNPILVPVNISGFPSSVQYIEVVLNYNEDVLDYSDVVNLQNNSYTVNVNTDTPGTIVINYNAIFAPITVVNGEKLFDIEFDYIGGGTPLEFGAASKYREPGSGGAIIPITSFQNGEVVPLNEISVGSWITPGDWSLGLVPDSYHEVVIKDDPAKGLVTLSANASAKSVTIQNDGQFTQSSGSTLIVTGAFTIESGGSFIQNGTVDAANKIAERSVSAYTANDDGWHLLSSPVASQAIDGTAFEPTDGSDDFFMWDETAATNPWINHDGGSFTSFGLGTGYLVAYSTAKTLEFSGDFNTGTVSGLTADNTGSNSWAGFTLLGNPYPSAIEWGTGWDLGGLQTTAYVWDESAKDYTTISTGNPIPAMNGFMVYLPSAGSETLDIPATARVHNSTQGWYKNEEEKIVLVAHDPSNESSKQHTIKFNADATAEYDRKHDAVFMSGYAPQFYSKGGEKALMVNTLPSQSYETVIPLTFKKNEGNQYVIELEENTTGQEVFLTDLKLGTTISLTDQPLYEFTSEEADNTDRFELKFSTVGLDENDLSEPKVYAVENMLVIENLKEQTNISVFNLNGQLMSQFKTIANNRFEERLNLNNGVYMIRLQSANGVTTKKVFIK